MGGQRLGEMEVWALVGYMGSLCFTRNANDETDDVSGRHKVYEAIKRGEDVPEPGVPRIV